MSLNLSPWDWDSASESEISCVPSRELEPPASSSAANEGEGSR